MLLDRILEIVWVFAPMSLLSFGGGQAIIPEMQHKTVDIHHWLDGKVFADIFGLSRAAPGPSTLIVALIGWQVAGIAGAIAATISIFLPSRCSFTQSAPGGDATPTRRCAKQWTGASRPLRPACSSPVRW